MLPQATITSVTEAYQIVKEMGVTMEGQWDGDYRAAARLALRDILQGRMKTAVDYHLAQMEARGEYDRRNGYYARWLLTELGNIELSIPRTRNFAPKHILAAYARRAPQVDAMILSCFLLGISTRKISESLLPVLGQPVSASAVSSVARVLDKAVEAFHRRPLANMYKALVFDGVVLSRKTGAGAIRKPALVALGIRHDEKKEVIDFRLAASESAAEWETFLNDLYRRGLTGDGVKIVCADGGKGMLAALKIAYPSIPVQRCWAHKMRNILDKVRKKDREKAKRGLRLIYEAKNAAEARSAARRWADRWEEAYPLAVKCLRNDMDDLLNFFMFGDNQWRKAVRTTNAIERRFREVRRRTRPMGVFSNRTSMERILFAVFMHENKKQGTFTPFSLTQNS
jgi:transposase-like protein